ncbi:hypothetical protein ACFPTX_04120 [Pseudomonas sp. GCM10022188]|uniref:hypothetical protein n=1 Tax=Pseudomonas TaxID=286 RepID=UPI001E2927AA|nr:hypothetical protein [Pseudomonas oryzagri]MCC6076868.1 hypothetical protein [Pseudomonas oryzagri]
MRRFAVGILLALILPLSACTVYEGDYGYEPYYGRPYPPPSYGDWRWDDDLRVYVSVGYPYVYYHDHTYYRWYDNHWSSGPGFRGPWRMVEHRHVPSRLGQRYYPRQYHDGRRDNDRYDYRQPRYENRDIRDRQDYRDQRDWQRRQDMERRDNRLEHRDERFGQGPEERQRRQLQQFRGREVEHQPLDRQHLDRQPLDRQPLDRQQPRFDTGRDPRQWQQRHDDRRIQPGMPINRQQMQGNQRRYERTSEPVQHRAIGGPSRRDQGNRPVSGQGQGQEQGDGRGQGHGQGRGAGGMSWGNQR